MSRRSPPKETSSTHFLKSQDTRDSFETIRYEATMVDPAVLTKPFTIRETFRLRPDERIREYECIESNEDIARFERLLQQGELPTQKAP